MSHRWSLTVPPGLEAVAQAELAQLGVDGRASPGAVLLSATLDEGAALARRLRTANRLMCEVVAGKAHSLEGLAALVRSADWRPFLRLRDPMELAVHVEASRLGRKDVIEKKVLHAIHDQLRSAPALSVPSSRPHRAQHLQLRVVGDAVSLGIDAGGERLGVRGWRQAQGKAPLRENLAASLLMLAGWAGDEPLLDPFCGAGTIPIEAALLAAGEPPGGGRPYAMESWPALQGAAASRKRQASGLRPLITGSDNHGPALADAAENAERAGVSVEWIRADIADPPTPAAMGLVVTNPPYGLRLGHSVDGVYRALGRALSGPLQGWRALFLCPDQRLARLVHPRAFALTGFSNGGVRVSAWAVDAQLG